MEKPELHSLLRSMVHVVCDECHRYMLHRVHPALQTNTIAYPKCLSNCEGPWAQEYA